MVRPRTAVGLVSMCLLLGCTPDDAQPPEAANVAVSVEEREYVGATRCGNCHAREYQAWQRSHHDLAMRRPDSQSVVADFGGVDFAGTPVPTTFSSNNGRYTVNTDNSRGERESFNVAYTFGIEPLQQFLIPLDGGRMQALSVAWDNRPAGAGGQRWMHLYPDELVDHEDVLHWTAGSQNWNHMCADCHSTAVEKNYDPSTGSYATTYEEINVACEACHGPGSLHAEAAQAGTFSTAQPDPGKLGYVAALRDQTSQINSCAPCHSRRSELAEGFTPHAQFLDHYRPALLSEGLYHSDGQILDEVYVYGSFLQSRMHAAGVACSDCHDPHSARLKVSGNGLCTQCHNPAGRSEYPTLKRGVYDDEAHHFHTPGSDGAACVSCHMPSRTYMQVDVRHDHSFRLPRPDLSIRTGVPNTCNTCHDDQSAEWAATAISERFGSKRGDAFGDVFHAARLDQVVAEQQLAGLANDPMQAPIVRATALSLMASYELTGSAMALRKALHDDDPLVVLGALAGSERWAPEVRWQRLGHLLEAPRKAVRIEAARLLVPALSLLQSASDQARLQTGIDEYLRAMRLNADRPEGQLSIAAVQMQLGVPALAEAALREALRLNPQFVPALLNLADLYRAMGRDADGGPLLESAAGIVPDSPDVLIARGFWLVRQQRREEALGLFASAFEQHPGNPRTAFVYAVALNSMAQGEEARVVLKDALARNPGNRQLMQVAVDLGLSGDE